MKAKNVLSGFALLVSSIVGMNYIDDIFGHEPWTLSLVVVASCVAVFGIWLMLKDIELP